ncbi:hypothetical protein CHARACLAT_029821 [Characodon lateralis]|uniref:Uncharacterized protein n=1 Tax=Characodon lateralis TaxID=208331 RepID=A0ABU7DN36_9TELE|nr:hypothetical protein [Characodon lateralis]
MMFTRFVLLFSVYGLTAPMSIHQLHINMVVPSYLPTINQHPGSSLAQLYVRIQLCIKRSFPANNNVNAIGIVSGEGSVLTISVIYLNMHEATASLRSVSALLYQKKSGGSSG